MPGIGETTMKLQVDRIFHPTAFINIAVLLPLDLEFACTNLGELCKNLMFLQPYHHDSQEEARTKHWYQFWK